MSRQIPLKPIAAAFLGACLIAGCHSGSTAGTKTAASTSDGATAVPTGSSAATATTTTTTTTAAASSAALPGNGLSGSSAPTAGPSPDGFVTKVCTAITIPHAQALVKARVTKVTFSSDSNEDPNGQFECDIDEANQALTVMVEPEDSAKANYTADVAAENVPAIPLPGVGDVAVWTQALHNPPNFYAHKRSTTCEVTSGDIRELSLTNDPSIIDGGVATPIAAKYAAKLGAICTDVFGAIG